jgi:hypothetical protein
MQQENHIETMLAMIKTAEVEVGVRLPQRKVAGTLHWVS